MIRPMQKPVQFLATELSEWESWPFGFLNTNELKHSIEDLVLLDNCPIYAVEFSDGSIWDMTCTWYSNKDDFKMRLSSDTPSTLDVKSNISKVGAHASRKLGSSLREADKIINGERQDSYGNPEDSFSNIAEYWSTYLRTVYNSDHHHLTALDVAHMMMLFKIARCTGQQSKRDNYIDIQGYAAIAADRLVKE